MAKVDVFGLNPSPLMIYKIDSLDDIVSRENFEDLKKVTMVKNINGKNQISDTYHLLDDIKYKRIKNHFDDAISFYAKSVLEIPYKFGMVGSWITKNSIGDHHAKHNHSNSMLSAVLYFDENLSNEELSPLVFYPEGLDGVFRNFKFKFDSLDIVDNLINAKRFSLDVKKNIIVVFPSWLDHSSIVNTKVEDRYCIGANYFLTDSLGKHDSYNGYNRLDVNV